jgi:hypothetical protein
MFLVCFQEATIIFHAWIMTKYLNYHKDKTIDSFFLKLRNTGGCGVEVEFRDSRCSPIVLVLLDLNLTDRHHRSCCNLYTN